SLVYEEAQNGQLNFVEDDMEFKKLTKRHIVIVALFALTIAINVYGIFVYGWFLTELAANFFTVGIIIGFVGGLKLNNIFDAFIDGMKIVVYGAIIVGFARAILVVLEILVHITTTVISGCIIALFTHWLRNRNNKRSEEHTSELQSRFDLVCRLLLEKKNKIV